jgi:hypothetical protein
MLPRIIRSIGVLMILLGITFGTLAFNLSSTSAHSTIVEQGEDYAVTDSNHLSGAVCDFEKDGNRVIARWYTDEGGLLDSEEVAGQGNCDQTRTWGVRADYVQVCEFGLGVTSCEEGRV